MTNTSEDNHDFYGSKVEDQANFIKIVNRVMCIIEFNMDGTILTANDNYLNMMGYELSEIIGKHQSIFLEPEYLNSKDYTEFWKNLREGKYETGEYKRIGKDGKVIWVYGHYNPILDSTGKPRRVVKFADNVTKMKNIMEGLDEREGRLSAILNTTVDGMITINYHGIIQTFNPACESIFGYKAYEVIGQNVNVLMPEPYHSQHDSYIDNYNRTGIAKIIGTGRQVEGKRKDGLVFPLELSVAKVDTGEHILYSGIVRDISARIKSENIKAEFISMVSHELRTPLTSIRGALGLISSTMAGELSSKMNKLITIAYKNSERLITLINDILDIDKIAAGKMRFDFKQESLRQLLKQTVEANRGYADKFYVALHLNENIANVNIDVDVERFYQICSNLLSNAIKFSHQGSTVNISTEIFNDKVRILVEDKGIGIAPEFHKLLFTKFSQADSSATRAKGGSGLGLHITKEIVDHMGGTIGFESKINKGSIFWVEFPIADAAVDYTHELSSGQQPRRVLICEDDVDIVTILKMHIQNSGYDADVAYSIAEARKKIKEHKYAALTLDLLFTLESGVDFIRELRENKDTFSLPIIVVSIAATEGEAELNGSAFGMIDWLIKPIDEAHLVKSLRRALSSLSNNDKVNILHVEDDEDLSRLLAASLDDKVTVINAKSLREARRLLNEEEFCLMVVDVGLPDGSGISLLDNSRDKSGKLLPAIVLSAVEVPKDGYQNVVAAMVKSRISETKIADVIMACINSNNEDGIHEKRA